MKLRSKSTWMRIFSPSFLCWYGIPKQKQRPGRSLKKQYVQRSNTFPGIQVSCWNCIFFGQILGLGSFLQPYFCNFYDAIHKPARDNFLGLWHHLKPWSRAFVVNGKCWRSIPSICLPVDPVRPLCQFAFQHIFPSIWFYMQYFTQRDR